MREIKFKAWHKQREEMLPVVDIEYLLTKGALITDYKDFVENIYPNIVQYTGFVDKNGVEIYFDCELLKHPKLNKTVLFVKDDFGIPMISDCNDCLNSISFEEFFLGRDYAIKDFEVIGNRFKNPELLGNQDVSNA